MKAKCVTDDTDVIVIPAGDTCCAGMTTSEYPRLGSLIEIELVDDCSKIGLVIQTMKPSLSEWQVPWLKILFCDGKQALIKSPNVRVINRRRRKATS